MNAAPPDLKADLRALRAALPTYLRAALAYVLFAWLAYNLYEAIQWIEAYYCPLPVEDYWRIPENLANYQRFHLAALWRQHNEHRIIFPEMVFAIDMLAAHGRLILPIVCSFVCYALALGVLCRAVMRDGSMAFYERVLTVLLAGVTAFWQGSAISLAQPFLLQWPMMQLGVVLSLFLLTKAAETSNKFFLAGAIGAAVVATYSSANALFLWPLLIGAAVLIHLPKPFQAALGIAAVIFVGLFFVGYEFTGQINLLALLKNPGYFAGFVTSYLSMPFGGIKSPAFGEWLGLLLLVILFVLFALVKRGGLPATAPAIVLGGYCVFCLLTVLITAAGRMEPGDPSFTTAKAPRYLSMPLINWAVVALLYCWLSARLKWRLLTTQRLVIASGVLLFLGQYKLRSWQEFNSREFADNQLAALSIDSGLTDFEMITRIFPSPLFVAVNLPQLRANHLSVFHSGHEEALGHDAQRFGKIKPAPVDGEITYTFPVEHGIAVVGWADDPDARNRWPWIVLANERGQVAGFGRHLPAGFPTALESTKIPKKEAWVAFVNLAVPYRTISAYLSTRHGLAPIQGTVPIPALEAANFSEVGQPVKGVAWHMDSSWTRDGIPVPLHFGWLARDQIYSSMTEVKALPGQISAEFAAPGNACVILPILHGRSITGAAAQLMDADTNQVVAVLPLKIQDPLWATWRVHLNSTVKRLRYVATDTHEEPGQWLAVSTPLECQ